MRTYRIGWETAGNNVKHAGAARGLVLIKRVMFELRRRWLATFIQFDSTTPRAQAVSGVRWLLHLDRVCDAVQRGRRSLLLAL